MYPLTTLRLRIEPLAEADIEAFVAYRREPDVARWQGWTTDYSADDARSLVASQPTGAIPPAGEWLQLGVHPIDGSTLLGDVAVHTLDDQPDSYEVGVTFDPAHQGRGLAAEALRALVDHLFVEHGAHRVVAFCDARNRPVGHLLQRVGFRLESHQVEADFFKNEWTTVDGYARLDREFRGEPI